MNSPTRRITWVGFAIDGALTKSAVHFLGCSGGVSAPYPAQVVLTKFNGEPEAVALDGARLNTPDGVRLDVAFPQEGQAQTALCGLAVEITSNQAREELDDSQCFIELQSRSSFLKYRPTPYTQSREPKTGLLIRDHLTVSSFVLLNPTDTEQVSPYMVRLNDSEIPLMSEAMKPWGVVEIPASDEWFERSGRPVSLSSGVLQSVVVSGVGQTSLCGFIVYRDAAIRRAISIQAV